MICVLDVIEGPARGKRIWLKENQCLEIGRHSSADFSIPTDSHLSRRHFLLDTTENGFRVRDMGSANGTFLNDERISVHELRSGDMIRGGISSFLVSLREKGGNPHEKDGITFSQSMSISDLETTSTMANDPSSPPSIRTFEFPDKLDEESVAQIVSMSVLKMAESEHENPESENAETSLLDSKWNETAVKKNADKDSWWRSFFVATEMRNFFEQSMPFLDSQGDFVGVAKKFADQYQLIVIVNPSQLSSNSLQLVERLRQTGAVEALSRTLCFISGENVNDVWALISSCIRQDAMICIGNKRKVSLNELAAFANSLSFPSMLEKHLRNPGSDIKDWLVRNDSIAMFELDGDGKIGLLIRSEE